MPEHGPGVRLEPIGPGHAEAMSRWMEDPDLPEAIGLATEPSLERTREWIARAEADPSYAAFAVTSGDRHVGNVVLDQIDPRLSIARLSIYIGDPDDRGAGVGTRSLRLALAHAFDELGLHKVWLVVHEGNAAAIAAYEKAGFTVEGVLRGEFLLRGERVNAVRMAVERPEHGGG